MQHRNTTSTTWTDGEAAEAEIAMQEIRRLRMRRDYAARREARQCAALALRASGPTQPITSEDFARMLEKLKIA